MTGGGRTYLDQEYVYRENVFSLSSRVSSDDTSIHAPTCCVFLFEYITLFQVFFKTFNPRPSSLYTLENLRAPFSDNQN